MPKDKKSKEKEGSSSSSSKEVELVVKRKNSIVDSSGGSSYSSASSAAASDNSGNTSDNSGDGEGFAKSTSDHEKGTMTGDSGQGTSAGGCSVDIRDRTEEMRRIMNENTSAEKKPVKLVDEQNAVPISDDTHLVPITNGAENNRKEDDQSPTSSVETPATKKIQNASKQIQQPKNQKQKQLTKKQKKEMERKKAEDAGAALPQFPGQKPSMRKAPLEHLVHDRPSVQVHNFNEWGAGEQENTTIFVRGRKLEKPLLEGQEVEAPIVRSEKELGPEMDYTDLHRHSQCRYLRYSNTIGSYTSVPAGLKPVHRMGYGIAASGILDPDVRLLAMKGSNQFMRRTYQDYIKSAKKFTNWRQEFIANSTLDVANADATFESDMNILKTSVDNIVNGSLDDFHKRLLETLRDGDLRGLVLRLGEMDRQLMRHKNDFTDLVFDVNMDGKSRKERFVFLKAEVFSICTREFAEKSDDGQYVSRSVSLLQYLSTRCGNELPCNEQDHRKCQMLYFLLSQAPIGPKTKQLTQTFHGGNTLLHMAAMNGAPCQVDVLLRNGATLNKLNDHFRSPLSLALRRHCTLVARQLMWHGADIGGSLNLNHILPKTPTETRNKQMSNYLDSNSRAIPYKAREFIKHRHLALNNTFVSWVESLIIESDTSFPLGIESVKSNLHQVRIGAVCDDPVVNVQNSLHVKKSVQMAIERTAYPPEFGHGRRSSPGQVVLFLIPCQYTSVDTTMPANFPFIVRMPMITDVDLLGSYEPGKNMKVPELRPIKMFSQPVTIEIGDAKASRQEVLYPFFGTEHNGLIYAYNLPSTVTKMSGSNMHQTEYSNITLHLTIPEKESKAFENCFFMVQALEVVNRLPPQILPQPTINQSLNASFKDPHRDLVNEALARHQAELFQEQRVRDIVADVQAGVAKRQEVNATGAPKRTLLPEPDEMYKQLNGHKETSEKKEQEATSNGTIPNGYHNVSNTESAAGTSDEVPETVATDPQPESPSKLPKTKTE